MTVEVPRGSFQFLRDVYRDVVENRMFGIDGVVASLLIALFTRGHVLLEGNPGLGKTALVRALSDALGLDDVESGRNGAGRAPDGRGRHPAVGRIQFTPDLMPSDITGTKMPVEDNRLDFVPGPIFCQLLLADEINRATPKTQSAMLEAMAEFQATVLGERKAILRSAEVRYRFEADQQIYAERVTTPFLVMATQNPIEQEGTYPLPEAQLDRFMFKARMPFPSAEVLGRIVEKDIAAPPPLPAGEAGGRPDAAERRAADRAASTGRALVCIKRAGEAIREMRPSDLVRRHISNIVMASVGRLDENEVSGLRREQRSDLAAFVAEEVEYPLGPRAAVAMTLACMGWTALRDIKPGEESQIPGRSVSGLAYTVIPVLRHRIRFRAGLDGFGADEDDIGERAGSPADVHDALVERFVKLCAPAENGYDREFRGYLDARPAHLIF